MITQFGKGGECMDLWDFRMFLRECNKMGQKEEILKILAEEGYIKSTNLEKTD